MLSDRPFLSLMHYVEVKKRVWGSVELFELFSDEDTLIFHRFPWLSPRARSGVRRDILVHLLVERARLQLRNAEIPARARSNLNFS